MLSEAQPIPPDPMQQDVQALLRDMDRDAAAYQEHVRAVRDTEAMVRRGRRLSAILARRAYEEQRSHSFEDYLTKAPRSLQPKGARRTMRIGRIPPELVVGRQLTEHQAEAISSANPELMPALIQGTVDGKTKGPLINKAKRSGQNLLDSGATLERAAEHVVRVLRGEEEVPEKPAALPPAPTPAKLLGKVQRGAAALLQHIVALAVLGKGSEEVIKAVQGMLVQLLAQAKLLLPLDLEEVDAESSAEKKDRRDIPREPEAEVRGAPEGFPQGKPSFPQGKPEPAPPPSPPLVVQDVPAAAPAFPRGKLEPMDYVRLGQAVTGTLEADKQVKLEGHLYRLLDDSDFDVHYPQAKELVEYALRNPATDGALVVRWLAAIADPKFEQRFWPTYHFFMAARLSGWKEHLHLLRQACLPQQLRQELIRASLANPVQVEPSLEELRALYDPPVMEA